VLKEKRVENPIDSAPPVRANATVDLIEQAPGESLWEVRVWDADHPQHERVYFVKEPSDDSAARNGIERFVEEMLILRSAKPQGH
jgi:hypothetical protein